jgi:hypothetical protein
MEVLLEVQQISTHFLKFWHGCLQGLPECRVYNLPNVSHCVVSQWDNYHNDMAVIYN